MPKVNTSCKEVRIRTFLKRETAETHAALDKAVEGANLTSPRHYAAFLQQQLAARMPVETWAARHCPPEFRPPDCTPLLIDDLQALGRPFSLPRRRFSLPENAHPIGLAWAIAGSHLGNRAMLASLGDAADALPTRFLSHGAMLDFWRALRPRLEADWPHEEAQAALRAAEAVFACFADAFGVEPGGKLAA